MRFWESSAVVPLMVREATSTVVAAILRDDAEMIVWWGTRVECKVASDRLSRAGDIDDETREQALRRLHSLYESWTEIQPSERLRSDAELASERHPLRAADALQLAAALVWCEAETEGREFVCLDQRLRAASHEEGFRVLPEQPDEEAGRS